MTTATRTTVTAKIPGLSGGDYTLNVKSSNIALDEARVPYGLTELVVALPGSSVLTQITPYASQRIQISVTHSWQRPTRSPQTRTYDFLLHERTIDHEAATLTLRGETDEALLIDRVNVSSTLSRTYGLSVKTAAEYALTQIGATLEAGAVDATLTSKTLEPVVTNLIKNPTGAVSATGWAPSFSASGSTITSSTQSIPGVSHQGKVLRCTMAASEQYGFFLNGNSSSASTVTVAGLPVVTPGKTYTFSVWLRPSVSKSVRISARTYTSGAAIITTTVGTITPVAANTWQKFTISFTADATAAAVGMFLETTVVWASGNTLDIGAAILAEGSAATDYFDGASTDPGLYAYAWTGTANASTSTKTNLSNTDATIWQPGQSLDDWLAPILQASNRRLFCDEHRKWRLVDAGYALDGLVTISEGFNAKTGTDTMSRQQSENGVPTWFDHVAVHYSWTDSLGVSNEAWDYASSGTVKGFTLEIATPWPGPGAATAILSRAAGRGRTQLVTALTDYVATPGMALVTTLPGTPIQTGTTSSVAWRWDESTDQMTVTSRGLISTPANAWLFAVGNWSAASGTWAAATGTG